MTKDSRCEIHTTEMSTIRMKWGEPHITIWVNGPKGGSRGMLRFDRIAGERLLRSLARACAALAEMETAAISAKGKAYPYKRPKQRKRKPKPNPASQLH